MSPRRLLTRGNCWSAATVLTVAVTVAALLIWVHWHRRALDADHIDCRVYKCVALTFDDGPTPFTDRLLNVLTDRGAKATFFVIGNKVAADPAAARRITAAGMEIANHTWEHPNMATIDPAEIPHQLSAGTQAITAATGVSPALYRPAGGVSSDAVRAEAGRQHLAEILWDVIPFDWINDADTGATRYMMMTQIKPGSVVLLHDTYSSTVDLIYQFLPVLIANDYHMVTVSHLLGTRTPGSSYGSRVNGPASNTLREIPFDQIPVLPPTPSPKPAPNRPITDLSNQNPGGPPPS